jgi:TonB family protein
MAVGVGLWLCVAPPAGGAAAGLAGEAVRTGGQARFELAEDADHGGLPAPGQRLKLHLELGGGAVRDDGERLVAIFEGGGMARALAPLSRGGDAGKWQATAWLELPAMAAPVTSGSSETTGGVQAQVVRMTVTFARIRGMALDRFAKRSLYITMGRDPGRSSSGATAPGDPSGSGGNATSAFTALDAGLPGVAGIKDEALVEHDLMAGSSRAGDFQTYWGTIGQRIRQRWGQRAKAVPLEQPAGYPRVRFRLYPNGVAQTIHLERSSGSPWLDEAGLESVVDTQPFPPFPAGVTEPFVNVYVDFRPVPRRR